MERSVSRQAPIVEVTQRPLDLWLLAALLALMVIGSVEIFSSSAVYALKKHGDSFFFLKRQLMWTLLGAGALFAGATIDYRWLRRWTYPLLATSLFLLLAVLIVGGKINGARRWFVLGPISFQPVELAKLSLVCYLAYSLSRKADKLKTFSVGFVPHLLVCAIMMGLLLKQPDLGSSIILGATTLTMLFVAGTKISYLVLAVLAAAPLAYSMVIGTPWRLQRFMAFFNPEAYKQGVAYQIVQAQIGIGSGGTTGTGLGLGRQQLGYMPEGHSDFILSGIGEEFGFLGICFILLLFGVLIWRGILAAIRANDSFGSYLAFGITLGFAYQALINTCVVLGIIPAKGLTLPFVSYGGSSLMMSLYLAGLLLSIGQCRPQGKRASEPAISNAGGVRRRQRAILVVE
ncbi:MAG: putative lipid II flippase FtsW [Kofleriaceae bacterium]|nr:putative lipid II flippase FtsW [Kofleriaceae bacterium]